MSYEKTIDTQSDLSKRTNSCCSKKGNTIEICLGWSGVCKVCGRYNYDEPDMCQVKKKPSFDSVVSALGYVTNRKRKKSLIKKIAKIKGYEKICAKEL